MLKQVLHCAHCSVIFEFYIHNNRKSSNFAIQLFEGKKVRVAWDEEQQKHYFSVADVVQVLTDSNKR